ncbi:MAG: diacylglycerol/lipid kinase family protein [Lachnospiraceae bacterium]
MKKLLFVFNPHSGKARIKNHLLDIIDIFNKAGFEVTTYTTQYPLHAKEIVESRGSEYDLIVCSGGDGTLNEVVSGIIHLDPKPCLGYIPAGSTNDFAASIGLPKSMKACAEIAVTGASTYCDIGQFNERYFTYVAAFGVFTAVTYMTSQQSKNLLGHQAYIIEGVKQLANIKPVRMKIEGDFGVVEDEFLFGMVSNSTSIGGFKGLPGKNVDLKDGVFETMFIRNPKTPIDLTTIVTSLIARNPDPDLIYTFKTSNITITSDQPVSWTLDGEYGGEQTVCHINNCHEIIQIKTKKMQKNLPE